MTNAPLESEAGRRADLGAFKIVTSVLALGTVVAAGVVSFVHERLHLSVDDARLLSSALLAIGIGDTLVLYYWKKIFRS